MSTCWKHFVANFNAYFEHLANENIKALAGLPPEHFLEFASIMLYGNDMSLLRLYVDAVLSNIFSVDASKKSTAVFETSGNSTKTECEYKSSPVHIEINIDKLKGCDKQFLSEFVSGHIVRTKNINNRKHIIVFHGVDLLSQNAAFALRKILECTNNAVFLMTCTRTSKVCGAITSRCTMFRCNVPDENVGNCLEAMMDNLDMDEISLHDSGAIVATLLRPSGGEDELTRCIYEFIDMLSKVGQLEKAIDAIRSFSFKMMHMNVPIAYVMRHALQRMENMGVRDLSDSLALAASLEHKSLFTNKTNLPIERFLLNVYKNINVQSDRKSKSGSKR